ncbi:MULTISPECIES: ABC transporter permease [Microbacterium]|uniref:ABC transporter permease n=1 Tax=Microbacterium TaxID=33882 RepID=UPI00217ED646|nr:MULTISPECIES: ABC transporter permease [Microbacterium]UWF78201.1 ABC transporter permease [Microbacterium neungamense]WCM56373.1 ABC transporter permease [Microbacterium sp. EF45047]
MTGVLGALADAWAEIRVHKMRVLLSLIGIAVSVAALTAVVAITEYQRQAMLEESDRWGGRAATIAVVPMGGGEHGPDLEAFHAHFLTVGERYGFSHVARIAEGMQLPVQSSEGFKLTPVRLIDPGYAVIHRDKLLEGREFRPEDVEAMAPPAIISEPLWERLGSVPLSQHPTLTIGGEGGGTYQVVGVRPRQNPFDEQPSVDLLYDAYRLRVDALPEGTTTRYDIWVPTPQAGAIGPVLAMDLRAGLPEGTAVEVRRSDWAAQPGMLDSVQMAETIMAGVAALILALGALSLINIQLVAMRQRVREIGVRRAFGATAGRVFTTVFLESLVATTVAGVVGIALVVAVLRSGWVTGMMFPALVDVPPFPMRAALTGLLAAVVVGALAGLVPALVALRVKVIDAIRF